MSSDRQPVKVTYAGKKRRPSVKGDVVEESDPSSSEKEIGDSSLVRKGIASGRRKPVDSLDLPGPEPRTKRPASSQGLKGGESTRSLTTTGKTIKPVSAVRSLTSLTSKTDATTRDDDAHDVSDKEGALRSSRTTEAERRSYLESHPDVAELEPHRVKCRCCDKWLKLSSTQNYALAPWKLHKKACTPENPCARKPRRSTGHEDVSFAHCAEDDDASSVAPSIPGSDVTGMSVTGRNRSSADRRRLLEEDELSGEVRPDSVYCTVCAKWVKLSTRSAYQLKNWTIHTDRVHGRTEASLLGGHKGTAPSNRVREAERKLKLVNDGQARDFTASRVTCKACSADVKLSEIVPYQLDNWLAHKSSCPGLLSQLAASNTTETRASKPVSTGSSTTANPGQNARSSAAPSITSTDLTCVGTDNANGVASSTAASRQKRAREDDEGEGTSKVVRVRTSSFSLPDLKPTGPWGWLKLPWETFKRGFAEGLGAGRGEDSNKEG